MAHGENEKRGPTKIVEYLVAILYVLLYAEKLMPLSPLSHPCGRFHCCVEPHNNSKRPSLAFLVGSPVVMISTMRGSMVLFLVAVLLSLPRAAFGTLGFDNEAGSCAYSSQLAEEVFTSPVADCNAYRAGCAASSSCDNCVWVLRDSTGYP